MRDGELISEIERVMMSYSEAWEGHEEEVFPLGQGVARWNGAGGFAFPRLPTDGGEGQLDQAIQELEGTGRRYLWVVGPGAQPEDLGDRLVARGFKPAISWDGLVLEDLSVPFETNPEVIVEEPSEETAAEVGDVLEAEAEGKVARDFVASSIRRYLYAKPRESHIFLGRLDGRLATYTATRFESNGTAYLRQGATHPDFQRRGLYVTLLAHRLRVAREAGCVRAVVQAITTTSSPILQKRSFRRLCGLTAYTQPRTQ